ncbi:hypothetical protein MUK42_20075 [Musa troglodytarum]|uniref:Uncharacterized protein n=1 Tax=Musa troglodytarum TaxID=320322 RepID=A0A9E7G6C8_9LILI|nr:hypothetical protein MUK42_20075 [Musa troglodytarum]
MMRQDTTNISHRFEKSQRYRPLIDPPRNTKAISPFFGLQAW